MMYHVGHPTTAALGTCSTRTNADARRLNLLQVRVILKIGNCMLQQQNPYSTVHVRCHRMLLAAPEQWSCTVFGCRNSHHNAMQHRPFFPFISELYAAAVSQSNSTYLVNELAIHTTDGVASVPVQLLWAGRSLTQALQIVCALQVVPYALQAGVGA